jgi:nucleoside-diphosphate-sugar epimerase
MNEKTPELATERKGVLRKELVQMLLEAQKQGLIRVSIGKASDFFGPNASNSLFDHFVKPNIVKNKPSKFFADITTKHSWIYLPDFAKSLVVLGTEEKADGKVWILPHYEATSIKEFIEQFYVSVGVDIPVKVDKSPMILLTIVSIFNKDIREYAKMNYQRQADWIVDDSLFRSTFTNWKSTNLNNAFNETYDSYKKSLSE